MKKIFSLLIVILSIIHLPFIAEANNKYCISYLKGTIILERNNKVLAKGDTLVESDILNASQESFIRLNKDNKIFSLRVNGKNSVQTFIDKIPEKYKKTINNLHNIIKKANKADIAFGAVTMSKEFTNIEFAEKEAYVCCKEDSLGNLNVIFMRHGMEMPMMYTLDATSHIYLLQMAVLDAQGYQYAYELENSYIYDILWKPLESFFKTGDIIYLVLPESLSVFEMENIPINEEQNISDIYDIYYIN